MLWLWMVFGCDSGPEVRQLDDVGILCIGEFGDYTVDFETTYSPSCETLVFAACTGEFVGEELVLTTRASIERFADECTEEAGEPVFAECSLPDIFDTSIRVRIGDWVVPFVNRQGCTF